MIFSALVSMISSLLQWIGAMIPQLPAMPADVVAGGSFIVSVVNSAVGLVAYLFTPPLLIFALSTVLVIINFDAIYHTIMWIVRKLPIGSH